MFVTFYQDFGRDNHVKIMEDQIMMFNILDSDALCS